MYYDNNDLYRSTYPTDGPEPSAGAQRPPVDHQPQAPQRPTIDQQLQQYRSDQARQGGFPQGGGPQGSWQGGPPVQPPRQRDPKPRTGLKIAALALTCALAGGAIGGGIVHLAGGGGAGESTEIAVSNRKPTEIKLRTVDGKTELSDAELYAANVNSVVSINITASSDPNFFGKSTQTSSAGSGFILTPDGYIVTNYHVVGDADTVKVTLYNGEVYDAKYIGGTRITTLPSLRSRARSCPPSPRATATA